MHSTLIQHATHFKTQQPVDIFIVDGMITEIASSLEHRRSEASLYKDATGLMLLPGMIDVHVHFRVPGDEQKEDWKSGSRAALAGGVTTVCDMPNNKPGITTEKLLQEKILQVKKEGLIDAYCYIGATENNVNEIIASQESACGVKVYYGTSTGELTMNNDDVLKQLFEARLKIPIVIHAEDDSIIEKNAAKLKHYNGYDIHSRIRSREAAISALETIIDIMRETDARKIHITHITTKEEVALIASAKKEGLDITCDVTPHHLGFSTDDLERLQHYLRVNPPLREKEDTESLWQGVIDGTIDMIASDHAPHTRDEKNNPDYWQVPSGVPGVETTLPFLIDRIDSQFTWERLTEVTALIPAQRFGFADRGMIAVGKRADLVLIDTKENTIISADMIQSKCGWSPWEAVVFQGKISDVFIFGKNQ